MIVLLIIVVVIFIYLIYKLIESDVNKAQNYTQTNGGNLLYKTKGIKSFGINGTYYTNLTPADAGEFFGFVKCQYNSHDQYAVGVYNENNESIGYIPKGNKRLNHSLTEWHNEKLIAWGRLDFNNYNSRWDGVVYIPIGFGEEQIKSIEATFKIITENKELMTKKELSKTEYFTILENDKKINTNLHFIKDKNNLFFYHFPKTIIPSFSKKLEFNKDWESLIKLEEYKDLIDNLNETFRNSTLKRIEIAKENLTK